MSDSIYFLFLDRLWAERPWLDLGDKQMKPKVVGVASDCFSVYLALTTLTNSETSSPNWNQ